jgi:selenide,water dikinase
VSTEPSPKRVILVGGGHAHVLLIKKWGMAPVSDAQLILVSPQQVTPYSGMLPGLVAGHYRVDDIHINLPLLCQWAGVHFVQGKVNGIDQDSKLVRLTEGESYHYDLLSIDVGSTPNHSTPGVKEFAAPVKPIAEFYQYWQEKSSLIRKEKREQEIVVVGGGAGSVEIILAMAHFLETKPATAGKTRYKLLYKNDRLLPEYPDAVVEKVKHACEKYKVKCCPAFQVTKVEKNILHNRNNVKESFDFLFWCTQASAAKWLADSGLACNQDGFVRVNAYLQAIDNPDVFAAGDIAHMDINPRPKAGVYAVRQGPYLYENLKRRLSGESLLAYKPQRHFLSLLALGECRAVGVRYPLPVFSGKWVWRWKNRIDQKFMAQFKDLP